MESWLQDLRYALRTLRRSPAFTIVAVVTLGLGIGANAAVFSLASAVFLRPIPAVAEPDRLLRILGGEQGDGGGTSSPISYPDYVDLAASARGPFSGIAAGGSVRATREGDRPTRTGAVSGNYFQLLGLAPALGRAITADDDGPAARPVLVVSHDLWVREFGGRADVLGRSLRLNGQSFTVVGVAPRGFHGTEVEPMVDVWVPLQQTPLLRRAGSSHGSLGERGSHWLFPIARLAPGATPEQAEAVLQGVARQLNEQNPDVHSGFRLRAVSGGTLVSAADSPEVLLVFTILMVVVGAVLCVACANVANLLLARAASRRREIAVRLSLGAGRGRLIRQLLTESLVLAAGGGVAGFALARLAPVLFRLLELPATLSFALDPRVVTYVVAVTLLTGLLFGLAPALQAVRDGAAEALRDGMAGGRRGTRLRSVLTAAQVALSLALLVAAGLLLQSLWGLQSARVPYDEGRVAVSFLDGTGIASDAGARRAASSRLIEAALGTPGVEAAAMGTMVPMGDHRMEMDWEAAGRGGALRRAQVNVVSTGYFDVLGLPVRAGRALGAADRAGGAPVAVISEATAAAFWPGRNPLGQRLRSAGERPAEYEVVGVVEDVVYARSAGVQPTVYLAWEQSDRLEGVLHVRSRPGATGLEESLARAAEGSGYALFGVRSLEQIRRDAAFPQRLTGVLLGLFGALALVLAAVGLYGVVGYTAAQRTREIGVRVALGARPRDVVRLVVGQGVRMAAVGVAVGVVLALLLSRLLVSLLFGVGAADPATFSGVAILLLAVAALASWLPARRAAAVEPMTALRTD